MRKLPKEAIALSPIEGQDEFGYMTVQGARALPVEFGLLVPDPAAPPGSPPFRFRPSAIMPGGIELRTPRPLVHGWMPDETTTTIGLSSLPGIAIVGELPGNPPWGSRTPLVELRHSKIPPGEPKDGPRQPEDKYRVFAVLFDGPHAARFGVGVLSPGHTGEEPDVYLTAYQVGERALEPGSPIRYYGADFQPEAQGMRSLPFGAFDPAVAQVVELPR